MTRRLSSLGMALLALVLLGGILAPAIAAPVTIVSNTTWMQSTQVDINDTHPGWPGALSLPAPGTFTLPTTLYDNVYVANVAGSTTLFSGPGVRYYRTTFSLPVFSALSADLQISVDNDVQIFINGHELALVGTLDMANFLGPPHLRVSVNTAGGVTNGFLGGDRFDRVASAFPSSNWIAGVNEIILVVRNLSGSDTGGFSFSMSIDAAPPVNRPPAASNDAATTSEDFPIDIAVLANDSDPDGDALSLTAVTQGAKGSVVINANQTVRYTPNADLNGSDSFTYTVGDGKGGTATAIVGVTILPVNDPPVAAADSANVLTGGGVIVDVKANDLDADGDPLTVTAVSAPAYGTAAIVDNKVSYRNTSDRLPPYQESLTYTVSDGRGGAATGTLKLKVVPRLPVLSVPKPMTVKEGIPLRFTVRAKDPNYRPPASLRTLVNSRTMPRGGAFRSDTLSWTPLFNQAGKYKLVFGARTNTTPSRTITKVVQVNVKDNRYPNLTVGGKPIVKKVPVYKYVIQKIRLSPSAFAAAKNGRRIAGFTGKYTKVKKNGRVVYYLLEVRKKVRTGYTYALAAGEKAGFEIRKKNPVTNSTKFLGFSGGLLQRWNMPAKPYALYAKTSGLTRPAIGNVDGAKLSEIIVGAGTGSAGLLTVSSPTGKWAKSYQVNWPAYNKYNGETWPAAGDLNRDGKAEIVVGLGLGGGGNLNVLQWANGRIASKGWLKLPDVNNYNGANGTARPAVGDLTRDGKAEIVVGVDGYGTEVPTRVYVMVGSPTGYRAARLEMPAVPGLEDIRYNCETWPAIGDLDGDGRNELVVNVTKVVNNVRQPVGFGIWTATVVNGKLLFKLRAFKKAETFGPPALGDILTPDGKAEIALRETVNKKGLSVFNVKVAPSGKWTITRSGSLSTGQSNPYPTFGAVAP